MLLIKFSEVFILIDWIYISLSFDSHKKVFIDILRLGLRPKNLSLGAISEGTWIPDEWAVDGSPRDLFVLGVLQRFCKPMMDKVQLIKPNDVITTDFAMGTDPAQLSIVDQLAATLLGYNSAFNLLSFDRHVMHVHNEVFKLNSFSRFRPRNEPN